MTDTYADGTKLLSADADLLTELALKLERAETGVGRANPTAEQRRAWNKAYTSYHLARVKLEQTDAVPCCECEGAVMMHRPYDDAPYRCPDCEQTPGFWPCEICSENGAVVAVGKDLLCQGCAADLKRRTDACLDKLTETISNEL